VLPVLLAFVVLLTFPGVRALDLYPVKVVKVGTDALGPPVVRWGYPVESGPVVEYRSSAGWVRVRLDGSLVAREVVFDAAPPDLGSAYPVAFERDGRVVVVSSEGRVVFEDRGVRPTVSDSGSGVVVSYVRDGRVRAVFLDVGGSVRVPLELHLRGEDPYVLVRDWSVLAAYRVGGDVYLAVMGTEWSVRVRGSECVLIHWEGGRWVEVERWYLPERWTDRDLWDLVLGRRAPVERVVFGVPVRVGDRTVWVFPLPLAPVVDAGTGAVVGWSYADVYDSEGRLIGTVEEGGDVLVFTGRWEGPRVSVSSVARLSGSRAIPGSLGLVGCERVMGVAFRDSDGHVRVVVPGGVYVAPSVSVRVGPVDLGPGEPLALLDGLVFYRTSGGEVRCAAVRPEGRLNVRLVVEDVRVRRWRVGGAEVLVAGSVVFDPGTGRAYVLPVEPVGFGAGGELLVRVSGATLGLVYDPSRGLLPSVRVVSGGSGSRVLVWSGGGFVDAGTVPTTWVEEVRVDVSGGDVWLLLIGRDPRLVRVRNGRVSEVLSVDAWCRDGDGYLLAVRGGGSVRVVRFPGLETVLELRDAGRALWVSTWMVAYVDSGGRVRAVRFREGGKVLDGVRVGPFVAVRDEYGVAFTDWDGEGRFAYLGGVRLEGTRLVPRGGGRAVDLSDLVPSVPNRWYVVEDRALSGLPGSWSSGGPIVLEVDGRPRLRVRSEGGRIVVDVLTPLGLVTADTGLVGRPLAAGWNGLLTVVYRASDGTVRAALVSPWPVVGRFTDRGVEVLVRGSDGWRVGPLLPAYLDDIDPYLHWAPWEIDSHLDLGDARTPWPGFVRRYVPAVGLWCGAPYYRVWGFILDATGGVVGYGDSVFVDGEHLARFVPILKRPVPGLPVPIAPVEVESVDRSTASVPDLVRVLNGYIVYPPMRWKARLPDGTIVGLSGAALYVVREGLATVLRLPSAGWDVRRAPYGVELRRGRCRLRVVLNPWPVPAVRAAIRGDRVVVERWEDGGYREVFSLWAFPFDVTPIEAADGTIVCLLGAGLVLWNGALVPARRAGDVLAWPAGGETLILPLAGRTHLGYVAGPPLRAPGRLVRVIEGGPTIVVTDRTMVAVRGGKVGEPVYRRDLTDGWFVAVFRFDDGFVVVLSDGRLVREYREYRSVTPTPKGLIVEDRDGDRYLLRPVRRGSGPLEWTLRKEVLREPRATSSGPGTGGRGEPSRRRGLQPALPVVPVPARRWARRRRGVR
jgi:hypothetical protein